MADLATTIAATLAQYGQPCTIRFPAIGLGSTGTPATSLTSNIRIGKKTVFDQSGQLVSVTIGTLPDVGRSLERAQIIVGTRTYNVVGSVETTYQGATLLQKVTLA